MSEYQYYEFLAIDRPLSEAEMKALHAISSRADISATRFSNEYNWGDLKADPDRLLERYFDVYVYVANWGTRHLGLRLPASALDQDAIASYCGGDGARVRRSGDRLILDWISDVEPQGWEEGSGWMGSLAPVRALLLRGDGRPLYLGWLALVVGQELDEGDVEPPVPPGLKSLSGPLTSLAEFLRIDDHLLAAAAEASGEEAAETGDIEAWIADLRPDEKDAYLLRAAQGEHALVSAELMRRFRAESEGNQKASAPRRTVGALEARAEILREEAAREHERKQAEERRRQEAEAAAKKERRLVALSSKKGEVWRMIHALVETRDQKSYDQAVKLLADLRDLASRESEEAAFSRRFELFIEPHTRKPTLMKRLRGSGLLGGGR